MFGKLLTIFFFNEFVPDQVSYNDAEEKREHAGEYKACGPEELIDEGEGLDHFRFLCLYFLYIQ